MREKLLIGVRHAQTNANKRNLESGNRLFGGQSETGLSPDGLLQASVLYAKFYQFMGSLDAVYSSPLGRATQTAEMLGLQSSMVIDPRLTERGLGKLTGVCSDQVPRRFSDLPELVKAHSIDPELLAIRATFRSNLSRLVGAESYHDVVGRVRPLVRRIEESDDIRSCLLLTHKHLMRCLMYVLEGEDPSAQEEICQRSVRNCSPIAYVYNGERWDHVEDAWGVIKERLDSTEFNSLQQSKVLEKVCS
jgi:broad specificity phosphatase PhoE